MKTTILMLLLLCACSGSMTFEEYRTEGSKASCAMFARCGIASSVAACDQRVGTTSNGPLMDLWDALAAQIAKGTVKFDGARARQCLDSYQTASCDSLSDLPAIGSPSSANFLAGSSSATFSACRGVFEGQVQLGAACGTSYECVPSAFCDTGIGGCGTCRARVQVGGAATSLSACADGLTILGGKCIEPLAEGATCSTATQACTAGTRCDGTCKKLKRDGEACTAPFECGLLRSCVSSKCGAAPSRGQSCEPFEGCAIGLACYPTRSGSSVCVDTLPVGGGCLVSSECNAGESCDGHGTCIALAPEGQPCATATCADGLYCNSSLVCAAQRAPGAACTTSEGVIVCRYGSCQSDVCRSYFASACT